MTHFSFVLIICYCLYRYLHQCCLLTESDAANGGTLRGTITDTTAEQKPIEGVEVQIYRPKMARYMILQ